MENTYSHPDDELLTAYSAGSLPLSQALCISTHIEHCDICAQKLQRLNRVGSELMQKLKPARASDSLKSRLMQQLDSITEETLESEPEPVDASVPRCLRQFIDTDYDGLSWKRISSDIQSVELCRDSNGAKVELIKIRPGGVVNAHTHLGDEYTVILEGSFSDESGLYRKGDFLFRDENDHHTPVATQDRACICLAVTEGPIQLTGFFSRLLNPLLRRAHA